MKGQWVKYIDRIILIGVIVYLYFFSGANDNSSYENKIKEQEKTIEESKKREAEYDKRLKLRADSLKLFEAREDSFTKMIVKRDIKIRKLNKSKNETSDNIINNFTGDDLDEFLSGITIPEDN